MHLHSRDGVAVSALKEGLLPLSQNALNIHCDVAYHAFEGIATAAEERARVLVAHVPAPHDREKRLEPGRRQTRAFLARGQIRRRIGPMAKFAAVPLVWGLERAVFSRRSRLGKVLRWGSIAAGALRRFARTR